MPSYGPEMRGGTANVTVILSKERISSPILTSYDTAIILNQQSLDKFENTVKPGGILIYNPIGISNPPTKHNIKIFSVKATKAATERNMSKIFNMIVLGGYLKVNPVVSLDHIEAGLKKSLPERHHNLIPANIEGLKLGSELIQRINLYKEAC